MKHLILICIVILCSSFAKAEEQAVKPKPQTIEELTKKVDYLNAALAAVIQQRNAAQEAFLNLQAQDAATAAMVEKK